MTKKNELLPCPFCSSTDIVINDKWCICQRCDTSHPLNSWNERHPASGIVPLDFNEVLNILIQSSDIKSATKEICERFGKPVHDPQVCSICGEISDFAKDCFEKAHGKPTPELPTVEEICEIIHPYCGMSERKVKIAQVLRNYLEVRHDLGK